MVASVLTASWHRQRNCLGKGGRDDRGLMESVAEDLARSAFGLERLAAAWAGDQVGRISSGKAQPAISARDVGHELRFSDGASSWRVFMAGSFRAGRARTAGMLAPSLGHQA